MLGGVPAALEGVDEWNIQGLTMGLREEYTKIEKLDENILGLRTTVPLVSYIKNSLRFWYYASFSTCCQNLEKNWGHHENLGESGGQTFKGSDQEKCQF